VAVVAVVLGTVHLAPGSAQTVSRAPLASTLGMRAGSGLFSLPNFTAAERWLGRPIRWQVSMSSRQSPSAMAASVYGEMQSPKATLPQLAGRLDQVTTVPLAFGKGSARDAAGRAAIRAKLLETARGAWDRYYEAVARSLVIGGYGDAVIRLGHENTGPFYPWSSQGNDDVFIAAFRHVHDVMSAVAPGLRFEWNSSRNTFLAWGPQAYPGDAYVDVVGIDIYYEPPKGDPVPFGADQWNRRYLRVLTAHRDFAAQHGKPVSYAEWANGSVDEPAFIERMAGWFGSLPTSGPGSLLYHSYFNVSQPEYSLANFPQSAATYRRLFGA